MESAIFLQIASAIGLSAVVGAIVNGIINRKKLGAEATHLLTQAAGGLVERLEVENKRLNDRQRELETRGDELEDEVDQVRRTARLAEWRAENAERYAEDLLAWGTRLARRLEQECGLDAVESPPKRG